MIHATIRMSASRASDAGSAGIEMKERPPPRGWMVAGVGICLLSENLGEECNRRCKGSASGVLLEHRRCYGLWRGRFTKEEHSTGATSGFYSRAEPAEVNLCEGHDH